MSNVSVCYTGYEVPSVVRKARDFTVDSEFREAIEQMYVMGVKCSEIEKVFGWKAGTLGFACDIGAISLIEPAAGSHERTRGLELLKSWKR